MIKGNRGQLSIFMGITLIVVMGMLAFVINIGLFVKAKINLQNATDAAAFSGAATQARQLTNIAYVNWELRNTYKEWMFKYYILGQTGLFSTALSDASISGKGKVNFLLKTPPVAGYPDFDKYNIPSICIHNSTFANICQIFAIPGIPRFPAVGVAGISEIHEAFVNKLVEEKGKDCSRRSKLNFLSALTWAFGSGTNDLPGAPLVAASRPGAWLQALELAFRIRNLEMIVNRPPVPSISISNINQLANQASEIGFNERPIKAFWSAYRNLGGGDYKDRASTSGVKGSPEELSYNFNLTELSPKVFDARQGSAGTVSSFLIPNNAAFPAGSGTPFEKRYVDLQLVPINIATMFTTFVDTANTNTALGGVQAEATCGQSRTALPVPGYILGYIKNPEVMTYYAVKGESKFIGLFFPINGGQGFKLTAYAAAKPFGGRIGPRLFNFGQGNASVEARNDASRKSASYVSGLNIEASLGFKPGMPIPSSQTFWVNNINTTVGGVPGTGAQIFYSLPNMIYDFEDESDLVTQTGSSDFVQQIRPMGSPLFTPPQNLGLYHAPQLKALKASLGSLPPGSSIDGDNVLRAIIRSRRPTKYDAINYLIPDFRGLTNDNDITENNAAPSLKRLKPILNVGYFYQLFAPLIGPNLLYKTPDDIKSVITSYMTANDSAVSIYLQALLNVADGILATPTITAGTNTEAARSIHINAGTGNPLPAPLNSADCKEDMATKFNHFFRQESTQCDLVPLKKLVIDFINKQSTVSDGVQRNLYYVSEFHYEPSSALTLKANQIMSAYFPGARQGALTNDQATINHPLGLPVAGASYSGRRNFYSTKFFHMAKIIDSPPSGTENTRGKLDYQETPLLREQLNAAPDDFVGKMDIKNPLSFDATTGIDNPFFLNF